MKRRSLFGFGAIPLLASAADSGSASLPPILPRPRKMKAGPARFPLTRAGRITAHLSVDPATGEAGRHAAELISAEFLRRTGQRVAAGAASSGFAIRIAPSGAGRLPAGAETAEAYELSIGADGALLTGRDAGLAYAASSFNQLVEGWDDLHVPEVEIADWPEFPLRGLFVEVISVAEMRLEDWKRLIRWAASLKLNALNVGLYNCWEPRYEFFNFRSTHYPQLKSPIRRNHFSFLQNREIKDEILPAPYVEEFLGEAITYGRKYGVELSPYFGSLGHNSLIPRLIPEVSMKDADGRPIGHGFCTTEPKTYEVLFNLYDEVIDRYARPYGVTTFHAGLDEVDHICMCERCRAERAAGKNFYVEHLVKLTRRLKERGMTRVIVWHDMLHRCGSINPAFEQRLRDEGIYDALTLAWWCYSTPDEDARLSNSNSFPSGLFQPKTGIRALTTPSAGWAIWAPLGVSLHTQTEAVDWLLRLGRREGSVGSLSYSLHDSSFNLGESVFAQYCWNQAPALGETMTDYARLLFGGHWQDGLRALKLYRSGYQPYASLVMSFYQSLYPLPLGKSLDGMPKATGAYREDVFSSSLASLDEAAGLLAGIEATLRDPDAARITGLYRLEAQRLAVFLAMSFAVLRLRTNYHQYRSQRDKPPVSRMNASLQDLKAGLRRHEGVMRELEQKRDAFGQQCLLERETVAHRDFEKYHGLFQGLAARIANQDQGLPEVNLSRIALFGSDLGLKP